MFQSHQYGSFILCLPWDWIYSFFNGNMWHHDHFMMAMESHIMVQKTVFMCPLVNMTPCPSFFFIVNFPHKFSICRMAFIFPKIFKYKFETKEMLALFLGDSFFKISFPFKNDTTMVSFCSWTTSYEDLLCSTEPFKQPIPLAVSSVRGFHWCFYVSTEVDEVILVWLGLQEMVDFLVDIWNEEGLYD